MYLGIASETPATNAAVDATKRQVLLYKGTVATTFFSSTSGGKTESSQAWTGTALPYLVSVPDPYDDISPYHDWGPVPVTAHDDREGAEADRRHHRRDDDAGRQRAASRSSSFVDAVHAGQRCRDEAPRGDRPALDVVHGLRAVARTAGAERAGRLRLVR